jgi:hypothetical protein
MRVTQAHRRLSTRTAKPHRQTNKNRHSRDS